MAAARRQDKARTIPTHRAAVAGGLFESCIAAIPYAPATAFLANEQAKLARTGVSADGEPPRVAILADGIGSTHGVSRTIEEIRQRGVPGFEIEVVATDPEVDRRLSAVAEFDVPFYPGLRIGVPSLSAAAQTLADGGFDAIHVCSPGPTGVAGALLGRALGLPLIGSYHTELTAYAQLRSGQQHLAEAMEMAVGAFYNACDLVLSPSPASDEALASIGMSAEKILRWDRGVDTSRFDPSLRSDELRDEWMEGMACPDYSTAQPRVTDHFCPGANARGERALCGQDHPREGRGAARRGVPVRACTGPAPAPRARRRWTRAGTPARTRGEACDLPRLAARRSSSRAPTRRPTSSSFRAPPTPSAR